ncbi:UvrD-helicase domain-containing protein [Neotamlana laminarinivorans]|uniref:DNA 3'-5' helicase n=1 Tax=Neotamlana laminarinivorans TaxID=2883124 RepID=A0A9X1L114_9FLAO|nr:UvrD-helicase domain-containing protein [Tamlana laminarinivorans]MCB4798180.1 UvrD-helicase domain-containing protein [Tamlana laminarinivorans]
MQNKPTFTIYNASAGSGKTFTLVKAYLKILLASNNLFLFKNILAITFTNKAVAEMKERIINTLKQFADNTILTQPNDMFLAIQNELNIDQNTLHEKAKKILNHIMHNYAAFDISTIDGFTHHIIRTFAYDLKLPLNFEVELDQNSLLNEAVDSLIAKAGTNKALTQILVDFAIEKVDDDKSGDVSFDFNKIAKLLVNENDAEYVTQLNNKTFDDFKTLKNQLIKDIKSTEELIVEAAKNLLFIFDEMGLQITDFNGKYLPNHLEKLANKNFNVGFEAKWQQNIETERLYPKRVSDDIAASIDSLQPEIASVFNKTKQAIYKIKFLKNFYKNITPLSVLSAINKELTELKEEQNKMLISEFNTLISKEIKKQPTPFIYERLGDKFNHFFIDEFQDTSTMQWENLLPLIGNSLATQVGSSMLVGDAKQAIYRWRGGKAEQFIDLFNKTNKPFPFINQNVEKLPNNFRSYKEIVSFNNGFFNYLATQTFSNPVYSELFSNAHQDIRIDNSGYVELNFLDILKDDDRDEVFGNEVLNTINNCLKNGYSQSDICVLVRKGKEERALAKFLAKEKHLKIISADGLLIHNSPEVVFINNMFWLLLQPKNKEIKIAILNFLSDHFNIENKHEFYTNHINLESTEFFEGFEKFNIYINSKQLIELPLYDLAETIVRSFNLVENSNAYIQFYLDVVLDFSQKKGSDISAFLEYFDKKKDNLSVVSPKGQNAIQIMTIHKSKGLEFPVVIFPYADLNIYEDIEPKEWYKLDAEKYNGFTHTLLNYNKDFEYFGEEGYNIYNRHQAELELDSINLLYVTLTRPVEQLYIISKKDINAKGEVNIKNHSGLFISYLQHLDLWNDSQLLYSFGDKSKTSIHKEELDSTIEQRFISTAKEDHNIKVVTKSGLLWDTTQQEAIEKGNLVHDIMAKIKIIDDVDSVLNEFIKASTITKNQAEYLKSDILKIINHPQLAQYFNSNSTIFNERDIIDKYGTILRPDRIVINSQNEATIIDYKTGGENKKHQQQLQLYQDVLEDMNFKVNEKILVYINQDINVTVI